ncbi:HlyD family secretion protein [Gallaecimonas kandeliae]|uniref:HlyD family secretion protein n=1 Tax=Gallaecimonas kandeliae TaxID=3029055 RepID=UPI0026494B55|nr:HlyD family secretion protein [Gallaecimonas kandeliae]WKE64706.1 HlyD family secretion protein [Gallaecimonas kandeliae]
MTADHVFNRWMRRSLVAFLVILAYVLVADVAIPMTPHAMVQRPVLAIAPQVPGEVVQVAVSNNQAVKAGDLLFRIDPRDYQLAVEKAELALKVAQQANDNLSAQLALSEADLRQAQVNAEEKVRERKRLQALKANNLVSQQQLDQADTAVQAAEAMVMAARQKREAVKVQLGDKGDQNLRIRQAQNQLEQARLNLSRTQVLAPESGVISNLQLVPGIQAQAKQSLMTLVVSGKEQISADFREKSLSRVQQGAKAWVVFDALPGQVFPADLKSRDQGVAQGQLSPNGQLAKPEDNDRWVRDAQRVRVYLSLEEPLPGDLVSGSRATVMLAGSHNGLIAWLGKQQMRVVSLLHYVY